jgi:hypothetical protein
MLSREIEKKPLGLLAYDKEDLAIISALFQDCIFSISAMEFIEEDGVFHMLVNRFMWERIDTEQPIYSESDDGKRLYQRTHSSLCFQNVTGVQYKGLNFKDVTGLHAVISIDSDENGQIHITMSGDSQIRLQVHKICCSFLDLDEPWYTHVLPNHHNEKTL